MLVDLINQYSADNLNKATKPNELGKDDFLNLLVTQLKNQDPLEPIKNEEFVAQLAQFNSLEQMMNLNKSFEQMLSLQQLTQASGFIGKQVSWLDENGELQSGIVSQVSVVDKVPMLQVGNTPIDISSILSVSQA
jgi:flagellar basal-body rod modification protein FlgD